jgi:glucose 1-dehydrogenase
MKVSKLFNLQRKTALVTGGNQGIGKAIALALAEYGAKLVIIFWSGIELAEQTKNEIEALERECTLFRSDLSDVKSADDIFRFLKEQGIHVDILCLNASAQIRNEWDKVTPEEFELQVNTNFRSSLQLIQRFYPGMEKKRWGRILTIGTVQQVRPHQAMIVYSATKMAQMNMVKSLAPQFGPRGVTINNLAPGAIATARNEEVLANMEYRKLVESKIPLGFVGEPVDCAAAALLLCSDAGRYITGQNYFVDGGMGLCF